MDSIFWLDLELGIILQVIRYYAPAGRARFWLWLATTWVLIEMFWHGAMERAVGQVLLLFMPF